MQCFESYAIRLKLYSELKSIYPEMEFNEIELDELIQDFEIQSLSGLESMNAKDLDVLINEGLARMSMSSLLAA